MEDKPLIIIGTILTITFNVLLFLFLPKIVRDVPAVVGVVLIIFLSYVAVWADVKVANYFIQKIKQRNERR